LCAGTAKLDNPGYRQNQHASTEGNAFKFNRCNSIEFTEALDFIGNSGD